MAILSDWPMCISREYLGTARRRHLTELLMAGAMRSKVGADARTRGCPRRINALRESRLSLVQPYQPSYELFPMVQTVLILFGGLSDPQSGNSTCGSGR